MEQTVDSLDLAIHKMAHKNLPALAKAMGANEQSLRNKVSPTNEIAKVSVQELRSMILITQDLQPLRVLANDFGLKLVGAEIQTMSVFDALLSMSKEHGDVASRVQAAFQDNFISTKEYCDVEKEVNEAKVALDTLLKALGLQIGVRR